MFFETFEMTSISNVDDSTASARMSNLTLSGKGNENCQQTGNQLSQHTGNSSTHSQIGNDASRLPDNSGMKLTKHFHQTFLHHLHKADFAKLDLKLDFFF